MSKKKRRSPTSVLIVCEGSVTEPTYFERLKEEIEEEGYWAITVYPDPEKPEDENPKSTALQLVKLAKERAEDFDEAWVVFDKDGYSKHPEAFALADSTADGKKKVNIAFSSIAFEEWVLTHFEKNSHAFYKSECREGKDQLGCGNLVHDNDCRGTKCICGRLRMQNFLSDYGKSANYDLYHKIRGLMNRAFINTPWLRMLHRGELDPIHGYNPYTDVDLLIRRLFNLNEEISWVKLKETMALDGIQFKVEPSEGGALIFTIRNQKATSIVLNQLKFNWINWDGAKREIAVRNEQLLPSKEKLLPFNLPDQYSNLCLEYDGILVIFDHTPV